MTCETCETCEGTAALDLCTQRRQEFARTFRILTDSTPMDLTGALIEMFILVLPAPLLTLSTATSGVTITVPETDGIFEVGISAADTYAMTAGDGSYELWINHQPILAGAFAVVDTIGDVP